MRFFWRPEVNLEEVVAIDEALSQLRDRPRAAKIVEMKFFGGLTKEEIGLILNLSSKTVGRDWDAARLWLRAALETRPD